MSIPCLHSPVVSASVPSASMIASSKNAAGCVRQTRTRVSLIAACKASIAGSSNRRQKSPAVVGSGMRCAPNASRYTSSCRSRSISCRHVPPHSHVVCDAQHVIRFVIRQRHLQDLHVAIDRRRPIPCAARADASRRSRHSPAHAPGRCAHTACRWRDTLVAAGPSRSRGRSRRSIRRLRRATCWCLLVFTRNVLPFVRVFGLATARSADGYGHFELFAYRRVANALVLGLVRAPSPPSRPCLGRDLALLSARSGVSSAASVTQQQP